ncbi:hypothetical protein GGS21DRAFT_94507 [Xylaria nigripes]|nr:hypothetical protein GGS21DRAFT_94507 [Xylaria nigripes]
MATASSQPPANSANASTIGAVRPSSTGVPSHSESPSILASSPSVPGAATNGAAHGVSNSTSNFLVSPLDESPGNEMRIYPRDGRVRNPVPSKLKNVNEQMRGNFGVMHMDVASHRASEGRDAAAKRTSESTALQAKLAQTDGYVSHQRRANYPRPPGLKQFNALKKSVEPAIDHGPPRPLTVAETKTEQARLLTLLRSLPHHTVVDQICKGLAFFGGVPDAPPPTDGKFPESAEANGSGSLFVGWIAEIFPDLEHPRPRHVEDPAAQATSQKRPRGRPKGSKATKARSDKGVKKGSQKASKGARDQTQNQQDDAWVDVEDSVLTLNDNGDLVEAMDALRDAPTTPSTGLNGGGVSGTTPATGSTAGFRSINDGSVAPGSSAKKRGRPKGSKNRPKDKPSLQSILPPKVTPVPVPVPMFDAQSKDKAGSAQPKSTKSRSKPSSDATHDITAANNPQEGQQQEEAPADLNAASDISSAQAPTAAAALSFAEEFAASASNGTPAHNQEGSLSAQASTSTVPSPVSQVKTSTVTAKKRKRPAGSATSQAEGTALPGGTVPGSQHMQPNATQVTSSPQIQSQAGQPAHQLAPNSAVVPQAKRVRKSQESSATSTARRPTPNSMSQKTPVTPVSVVTEPEHQPPSEELVTQNHPPAEGLEAHYAAMQSHTDQMQSYTSRTQHKQQPHPASSMGSTVSPVPATAPVPAGSLDAHYERFANTLQQNLSDNSRSATAGRQKQQQQTQIASPIPTQASKLPQSASLTSQQQTRGPQTYYSQGSLGSSYNSQQQPSYSSAQRSQQHISSSSSNTGLVQHVTNSPQFSTQSNSPLMQTDNNYRSSPSLIHTNAAFATRRTPSASPLDNSTYRTTSATNHGVASHSPHFGARQTSATATAHTTSHSGLSSNYPNFSDPAMFELGIDSSGSHNNLGMGSSSYGLSSGPVSQQQRSSSSNAASLYSSSAMSGGYLGSATMGRTGQQNRWGS